MTTPEQKHQKSETMKDLYQKPELRFVEVSKQEDGETSIEVMVGDAQVGSVEMTPPGGEDGDWFVIAVYYDHVGQACEQEGFANHEEAMSVIEKWYAEWWDATWRALCGEPMEQATVSLTLNPLIMQTDDSVSCGSPDNVIGSVVRAKGRYLCLYEYAGEEIFATKKTAIEIPVWFEEVHSEMLVKLMTKNVLGFDMTTGETP